MPTDTERREVAERLREKGIRFYSPSSWDALGEALGIDGPRNSDAVCARLTDLIEPCDTSQGRRDTVACDRDSGLSPTATYWWASALKYVWRAPFKNGEQDIAKAIRCLEYMLGEVTAEDD